MGRKKKRQQENPRKDRSSPFAILFGIVWVGAWTIGVAWFDWVWVTSVVNQIQTLSFPNVPGQVVSSEIVEEPGDESILYRPDIGYGYVVGSPQAIWHSVPTYPPAELRAGLRGTDNRQKRLSVSRKRQEASSWTHVRPTGSRPHCVHQREVESLRLRVYAQVPPDPCDLNVNLPVITFLET